MNKGRDEGLKSSISWWSHGWCFCPGMWAARHMWCWKQMRLSRLRTLPRSEGMTGIFTLKSSLHKWEVINSPWGILYSAGWYLQERKGLFEQTRERTSPVAPSPSTLSWLYFRGAKKQPRNRGRQKEENPFACSKRLWSSKDIIRKVTRQPTEWEKILGSHTLIRV